MNFLKKLLARLTLVIFALTIIFPNGFLFAAGENILVNSGFEQAGASNDKASDWYDFHNGYTRDQMTNTGSWGIKLTTANTSELAGAYQKIDLQQTELKHVYIGGYVKGENIVNSQNGYFGASMYAEIHLQNGQIAYWNSEANLGSFDWRQVGFNTETLSTVNYPINFIYVVPILGRAQGTAYFDDIIVNDGVIVPEPICGDGNLDPGEECDDSNILDGDGCSAICTIEVPAPACGDGNLDPGEECDDANTSSGDGCSGLCAVEYCGDNIINNVSELCDNNSQTCTTAAGYSGEQACNLTCNDWEVCATNEYCGDGIANGLEECDDSNTLDGDGCSAICTIEAPAPACGDGNLDPGEECDDANIISGDGCSDICVIEVPDPACGDGNLDPGEECDDSNTVSGDGCSDICTIEIVEPVCGNGIIEAGEECDDSNTVSGDGCSALCVIEVPVPQALLINPGFEEAGISTNKANNWQDFHQGYTRVATNYSGQWGIKLTNRNSRQLSGASQRIDLNQSEVKPVFIGGYVKGNRIVKQSGSYFGAGLYAEIHLQDGSTKYWNSLANNGTFDWRWIGFNTATISLDGDTKFINQPISYIFVVPILANARGTAYFDDITVREFTPTQAAVTLMFDDGEDSAYTIAKPIMDGYNFNGSTAVITDVVGAEGFMDWSQIKELETSGWEIASHGLTHRDLTGLSTTEINRELSESKTVLQNQGLVVNNFILPYGAYNDYILAQGALDYTSVRAYELGDNPQGAFPNEIKIRSVVNSSSVADVADWIVESQSHNTWTVIVFHTIADAGDDAYYIKPAVFTEMIQAVADSGIQVLTYDQVLKIYGVTKE